MSQNHASVSGWTYAGLFLVTLATLMYELLLTRIFSVTMWYHFAFVAISVAMFGMTVGALLVYLLPSFFTAEQAKAHLAWSGLLFGISMPLSFLTHLSIPFNPQKSVVGLYSVALTYVVIAVPFVFSGICVCLALTRFPDRINRLYAADLAGAAVGCVLLIATLIVTDGPTAVLMVAALVTLGAFFFAVDGASARLRRLALVLTIGLGTLAAGHTILVHRQAPVLRLVWVKGQMEDVEDTLYERWNSFSRIRVLTGDPRLKKPTGWGLSSTYTSERPMQQLGMNLDATAGTVLTGFRGDLQEIEHLKYDVVNIAHYLRPQSRVLVVGTGGGRDILSALAFDQPFVLGVEINQNVISAVNDRFGDFTGHLDRHPRVAFVNDEARSYAARNTDPFDIIQVALIDTWAATSAGAFVLSENSLYTVEAWEIFLKRLTPRGVLTFSRWYFRDRPGEVYRLTALASSALSRMGVEDPRRHLLIVRHLRKDTAGKDEPEGVGTILVTRDPLTDADVMLMEDVARRMDFDLVLSPRFAIDEIFSQLASGKDLQAFTAAFPINIAPPTDDAPFFFNMLRLRSILQKDLWEQGQMGINMKAVVILGILLATVVVLTSLCVVVPLVLTTRPGTLRGSLPFFAFFAAIGFGFMLVEISQMQRLIIFLGHPTYGLSVVLFALLLSSGIGAWFTERAPMSGSVGRGRARLIALLLVLAVFGASTPHLVQVFQGSGTVVRIALAVATLFPLGLFMGMAFPLGMAAVAARRPELAPWLWGINGATSVCSSVVAVAIALSFGISTAFWTGFACYVAAMASFLWLRRGTEAPGQPATAPGYRGPWRWTRWLRSASTSGPT
jgi:hypothetical protein